MANKTGNKLQASAGNERQKQDEVKKQNETKRRLKLNMQCPLYELRSSESKLILKEMQSTEVSQNWSR